MTLPGLRAFLLTLPMVLASCFGPSPRLAPVIAEPNTRPARNFTSFAPALRCMDGLLAKSKRGRTLISSTDIPDETNLINVGADDMLINALSRMTRQSQRYVFVDQALIKFGGLLDVAVQNGDEVVPQYYIRGSISQLDREVSDNSGSVTVSPSGGALTGARFGPYRKLSVVSVDMHLVAFPSRKVVAGASVANSMVVVGKGFGASASGLIDMATLGLSLEIERVESQSQAVRNLIELGLIELLGRHAGVPYWTCLAIPDTSARQNEKLERKWQRSQRPAPLGDVQMMLAALGYLSQPFEAALGARTRSAIARFQADEDMLPNWVLDYDLSARLFQRTRGKVDLTPDPRRTAAPPAPVGPTRAAVTTGARQSASLPPRAPSPQTRPRRTATQPPTRVRETPAVRVPAEERGVGCPRSSPGNPCDDSYINLFDFLNTQTGGG
ncbi:MAG: peptidoglycan-binding domain-containing protein [Pseudomonadota bacterium]